MRLLKSVDSSLLLALGVAIGFLIPSLAEILRPLLPLTVWIFVAGTFLRTDVTRLRQLIVSFRTGAMLPVLVMLVIPVAVGWLLHLMGMRPDLSAAIVLTLASPPSSGNAAMARLIGYKGELPLAIILVTMCLAPITMPFVAAISGIEIDPWALLSGLTVLLAGTGMIAFLLRHFASTQVFRHSGSIDRIVLGALIMFAIATMDGVNAMVFDHPWLAALFLLAAVVVNFGSQAFGALIFKGKMRDRLSLGLTFGNRNVGLPWAVLGASLSPTTALFFALAQIPIFISPWILKTVVNRRKV